ncbi:hypothetical protein BLA15945_07864 [Burkholderia lata]|uniref:Uncharacterized protein n=1 Tax=Burkholderia lata (strain ATCC 17760 / DSM 23089 / LMG 22485 / NCIMB 9086 / R18194 / 383) TaxID=482957 RepID=A0A6P2T376_BURL3|nr:hypothetical protein BLA15945_07864 [Burkholderia lata]
MQRVEIRGIIAGRLQHAPPQRHCLRTVSVGALRERPGDPVCLRPRVGALVQEPCERHRRARVLRVGRDRAAQRDDRRLTPARRIRHDLVILGAERALRRTVRKQRDDPPGCLVRAAAAREQTNLRHLAAPARRDAVLVGHPPRGGCIRRLRLQARERRLRAFRVAEPQQHAHLFGQQVGIARRDQQPLAQRVAREVVAMLDAPHPRGVELTLRVGGRRGRRGRSVCHRRVRCGARRRRAYRRREPRESRDVRRGALQRAAHERPPQQASSVPSAPNR